MTSTQVKDPQQFREKVRSKLIERFGHDSMNPQIFANIEIGVYNYAIKEATNLKVIKKWDVPAFSTIYMNRLRTVYLNLKNTPDLITMLRSEELNPRNIAFMTHQEFNPSRWKEMIEQKMKRDANKYSTNIEAMTEMFTCKKCKSKRCTYYELQTRSADEPSTIFISCLDCGKHWKQN
jgi:transcription elongation factor S-II